MCRPSRLAWLVLLTLLGTGAGSRPGADAGSPPPRPDLADAEQGERLVLNRLLGARTWSRRAIAAVRLERYGCAESRTQLAELLVDEAWQVRAYAVRSLGRRAEPAETGWFAAEQEPRVLRTALRYRYAIDPGRLDRGVRFLARSASLEDKMLAVELGAASGDEDLEELARETAKTIINRMTRAECGAFSPRLAYVVGGADLRRAHRWRMWLLKKGRSFRLGGGHHVEPGHAPLPPAGLAEIPAARFAALEDYIEKISTRDVDLAICLDCTASMSGELTAAQAGIDDLMLFVGDVVRSLRVGIVAYRDRHDRDFETRGWDFDRDIETVRGHLWSLEAAGGGDTPEAVHPALKLAHAKLSWQREHTLVLILIGDAPPHVGYGTPCVELTEQAAKHGLITHTIQAENEDVPHFAEIAEAGGGHCLSLEDDDRLIAEIAGLTLGEMFAEEFREFFATYLELCR